MKFVINLILGMVFLVNNVEAGCDKNDQFDYLLLAMEWPAGYQEKESSFPIEHWTIHGVWPSRSVGSDKYPCMCSYERLNENLFKDYLNGLNTYWPSLKEGYTNERFWEHEWLKHGTCSGYTQHDYFGLGLVLRDKFDPLLAGIGKREENVDTKSIKRRFKMKFGAEPMLGCKEGNVLSEIGVCLDKETKQIKTCENDVTQIHDEVNNCDEKQNVIINSFSFKKNNKIIVLKNERKHIYPHRKCPAKNFYRFKKSNNTLRCSNRLQSGVELRND